MMPGTRLMSKIHCQERSSTNTPPSVGPSDGPRIVPSAKIDWLVPICEAGNVSRKTICAVASNPPPKAPCSTRKKINASSDVAVPQSIDAIVKPAIDARK